jgi:hypothetical protein
MGQFVTARRKHADDFIMKKLMTVHGFAPFNTGGNCMALCRELPDGGHLLITAPDDARIADADATHVAVGRYDADGDVVGGDDNPPTIPVAELGAWIAAQLEPADIKSRILQLQDIQRTQPETSQAWQAASRELGPLFAEMAKRFPS